MSAASPGVIAVFSPNRYYASQEEYLGALAEAMREEYEAIHRAGLVLQLDCPDLAMTAPGAGSLENFRRQMELNIEALNHALANIPAEATRIHICWGNGEMPRTTDVELKDIIDIVLKAKPAGLMLMASNGRHAHEWKVFGDVKLPDGKYVIPGVLDSTTNVVEHPEVVADRLIRYAEVVGRDNVMAGTDCGFGTIAGMDVVVPTVTWAKFRSQARRRQDRLRVPVGRRSLNSRPPSRSGSPGVTCDKGRGPADVLVDYCSEPWVIDHGTEPVLHLSCQNDQAGRVLLAGESNDHPNSLAARRRSDDARADRSARNVCVALDCQRAGFVSVTLRAPFISRGLPARPCRRRPG